MTRKYTLRYTRQEVVAGTEIPTGNLVRCSVTIEADSQREALQDFQEEYAGSDARITSIAEHQVVRTTDHRKPTETGRVFFG